MKLEDYYQNAEVIVVDEKGKTKSEIHKVIKLSDAKKVIEKYGKQARIDENNGWVRKCNEAKGHGLEADQFTIEDFEKRNKELK